MPDDAPAPLRFPTRLAAASWLPLLLVAGLAAQDETRAEAAPAPASIPAGAPPGMVLIDRSDLLRHASWLADDARGGRYTGSRGQQEAARYIAEHFEELGLRPLGDRSSEGRSFFQRYPLERVDLDPQHTGISIGDFEAAGGFAVVPDKSRRPVDARGTWVFCGQGSPDELPKGGLRSAIPVVAILPGRGDGGPGGGRGRNLRQGFRNAGIVRDLANKGAKVVVFCLLDDDGGMADSFNYGAVLPDKPLLEFGNGPSRAMPPQNVPMVFVNKAISNRIFAGLGVTVGPGGLDQEARPKRATGRVQLGIRHDKKGFATNVVAVLEGSDPRLRGEAVVFSAHMDHMGTRLDGDPFNGADDNASGTAGLLDIAEAFARGGAPGRSVLFLAVSGEEEGLWGSEWFAENPTWPLQRIAANINIDMIGRDADLSGLRGISVTPSRGHEEYNTVVQTAWRLSRALGMDELGSGDTYYQRSDHYNFASRGVPVVFFCDGEHEDYHKVTDHADKLDGGKMELVARLAYWTGWTVATDPGRPRSLGRQREWDGQ